MWTGSVNQTVKHIHVEINVLLIDTLLAIKAAKLEACMAEMTAAAA